LIGPLAVSFFGRDFSMLENENEFEYSFVLKRITPPLRSTVPILALDIADAKGDNLEGLKPISVMLGTRIAYNAVHSLLAATLLPAEMILWSNWHAEMVAQVLNCVLCFDVCLCQGGVALALVSSYGNRQLFWEQDQRAVLYRNNQEQWLTSNHKTAKASVKRGTQTTKDKVCVSR
jgi:hypothetical protein